MEPEEPTATPTVVRGADLVGATRPLTPMAPHLATAATTRFVPGRRDWVTYLETGFSEASGGRLRATLSEASGAPAGETGWHYHECEMQIAYITRGWIELQFEDGTETRLEAGDLMFLPGGTRHNETRVSPDVAGLEISIPAAMGTVPCDPPEGWTATTT